MKPIISSWDFNIGVFAYVTYCMSANENLTQVSNQSPTFPNHGLAHIHGLADVRRPYIQLYWLVQSKHMYVPRHVNLTWNVASTTIHAFSIMDRGATPRQFMNGHAGCHCEDQLVRDFIWARVRWLHCYVLCCAPYICPEACFAKQQEENAGLFLQPSLSSGGDKARFLRASLRPGHFIGIHFIVGFF